MPDPDPPRLSLPDLVLGLVAEQHRVADNLQIVSGMVAIVGGRRKLPPPGRPGHLVGADRRAGGLASVLPMSLPICPPHLALPPSNPSHTHPLPCPALALPPDPVPAAAQLPRFNTYPSGVCG